MKVAILAKIARQVEGEMVFINVIKAHVDPDVIRQYLSTNELPRTEEIQGLGCVLEYGVFTDVEVEGITSDSSVQE